MREIVDKHFPDNWVVPIYQGHLVDLTEFWAPYPAATKALQNCIIPENIKKVAYINHRRMNECIKALEKYIIDGHLQDEFVLDNVKDLINVLRESNIACKWLMLHKHCKNKKFREIVEAGQGEHLEQRILDLLLNLSKFEHLFKIMLQNLVTTKHQIWESDKQKCFENMNEIAEYFAGNRNWGKNNLDENYASWFKNVTQIVESLDYKHSAKTGRKIQQLI